MSHQSFICQQLIAVQMDIGVGSFVFSQGIVSAIPLVKNPAHLTAPLLPKVSLVLRKCSPVLLLGFLRTISVKGTEYPVSNAESPLSVLARVSFRNMSQNMEFTGTSSSPWA